MDRGSSDAPPNMSSFPVPGSWSEENAGAVRGPPAVWILAANTVPMIEHVTAAQGTWAIWPPEPSGAHTVCPPCNSHTVCPLLLQHRLHLAQGLCTAVCASQFTSP